MTWDQLDEEDRATMSSRFTEQIFPVLTPLSVDPAHPFPYISNLSLNLAAVVRDPMTGVRRFARVKVPPLLPRFVSCPTTSGSSRSSDVIAAHLDVLFPGMEIVTHHLFRVTRDADVEVEEDEAEDLLEAIEGVLRRRRRGASPVRLEIDDTMTPEVLDLLMRELDLAESEVYVTRGLLDLSGLWSLVALDRPDLKDEPWTPVTQPRLTALDEATRPLRGSCATATCSCTTRTTRSRPRSRRSSEQAARDPDVLAIKQTLYRTSAGQPDRPLADPRGRARQAGGGARRAEGALRRAGEHHVGPCARGGGRARRLRRRRPEDPRQDLARRAAGGRRDPPLRHIGTGNYNPSTARLYEDLGLLTADPEIGADLTELFNLLTGYSRQRRIPPAARGARHPPRSGSTS